MPLDATDLSKIKAVVIDALSAKDDYQSPGIKTWATERGWGDVSLRYEADQAMAHSIDARNDITKLMGMVATLLARDPADVDEAALATALVALLPQIDTASILTAIQALPTETVAAIKAAL
jgi:hypothetical protein